MIETLQLMLGLTCLARAEKGGSGALCVATGHT